MIRAIAIIVAIASLVTASAAAANRPNDADLSRAKVSYAALARAFATSDGSDMYREWYPRQKTDSRYSYEWPFSQVHVALLDLTGLSGKDGSRYDHDLASADAAQLHYWAKSAPGGHPGFLSSPTPPYGKGHTLFYDDNEWVGLEALQDYCQHHSKTMLKQAESVFDLATTGWDRDRHHARPGGVFWMQSPKNDDRNTVSNMPAAELGVRLYGITRRKSYLAWATRMYRWANRNLQRSDGLFYDHVDLKGHVDRSIWSYNQGVPIAANLAFYRATGKRSYLREAERIASATYRYFVSGRRLDSQPVYFNAIMFKHMLALESVTGGSRYRTAMQAYADHIWRDARNPRTGIFHFGTRPRTDVIEQAAAIQIFAILAWPRSALVKIT